jgi:hypothetical protein
VGLAFSDEVSIREVEDADDSERSTDGKVLVVVTYSNRVELVRFSFEGAAFQDELSVGLAEIPVGDFTFLAYRDEFVIVVRGDAERVNSTHALGLGLDTLFTLQVPEEDGAISGAGE